MTPLDGYVNLWSSLNGFPCIPTDHRLFDIEFSLELVTVLRRTVGVSSGVCMSP